jgi:hypothetical protein
MLHVYFLLFIEEVAAEDLIKTNFTFALEECSSELLLAKVLSHLLFPSLPILDSFSSVKSSGRCLLE